MNSSLVFRFRCSFPGRLRFFAAALALWLPLSAAAGAAPHRDEVVYQLFVRSFFDSNGDRIGDLNGIRAKLDYLNNLGVTSLILTPVQPSPFYHHYFAANFEGVDPELGTRADLQALIRAVHARGMKLYLDQEIQYVTESHPWYKAALHQPDSPYRDFVLSKGNGTHEIDTGFLGLPVLPTYDGRALKVATVNLLSPAVRAYFEKLFVSWVDPHGDGSLRDGVDGFRIDHMMDDLDNRGRLTGLFNQFWRPIFERVRAVDPKVEIIAEQADWTDYGAAWLTKGDVDCVYAYPLRTALVSWDKAKIEAAIAATAAQTPPGKGQLLFIENHDVTRWATIVGGDRRKEKIGAAFDVLLQGTPLIYYGQELGMRGLKSETWGSDANDIPLREAFRWRKDLNASGSATWYRSDKPWWVHRFNDTGDGVSLEEEASDPGSLYRYYVTLLRLRAERAELQHGSQAVLANTPPQVIAIERATPTARSVLVINLGVEPVTFSLSAPVKGSAGVESNLATSVSEWPTGGSARTAWIDLLAGSEAISPQAIPLGPYAVRLLAWPLN